jgi:hypothetical protein
MSQASDTGNIHEELSFTSKNPYDASFGGMVELTSTALQ